MPYPNPADLEAMKKDPNVTILDQPGLNIGYLAYNTTKKPFDDVRVRKAMNMAINKKAIIDAVYLSSGVPAKNPIPPSMWSYNDAVKDDPYDPDGAKKLLAEAGFPNGLETDLWAMPVQRPYNPNAKRIAELMQADLAKVGVKAEIKTFEWGEYRKRMQAGEHQMGMLGWTGDNGDPDNFLHTLLGCDSAQERIGLERRQVLPQAVRRPRRQGEDGERPEAAHGPLQAGPGDLQGAGALVHHRPRGAAEAGAQGSRRLQALAVRPPHLLRRGHQGQVSLPFGKIERGSFGCSAFFCTGRLYCRRPCSASSSPASASSIPTFIGITLLAFFLIRLVPGDPIETMAGERGIDPARHEQLRKEFGFDRPLLVQYGIYIVRVLQGDLGKSFITQEPVLDEFGALFPATLELASCAILFALDPRDFRPASSPPCAETPSSTTASWASRSPATPCRSSGGA